MNSDHIGFKDILDLDLDNSLDLEDILNLDSIENELSEFDLIELREEFELDNKYKKNNIIAEEYTKNLINEKNINIDIKNSSEEQILLDKFIDLCVRFIYLQVIKEADYIKELRVLLDEGLNVYKYNNKVQLIETLNFLNYEKAESIIDLACDIGKCSLSIQKKVNCFKNKELDDKDFAKKILNKKFNEVYDSIDNALIYINSFKMIYDKDEKVDENNINNNKINLSIFYEEVKLELLNRLILLVEYFGINTLTYVGVNIITYQQAENILIKELNDYYIEVVKTIKKYLLNIKNKLECFIELSLRLDKLTS